MAASISGQISGEDFDGVLIPAVLERQAKYDSLRILFFYTTDFHRFTTTAAWDDEIVGLHHLDNFEKIAIVTDVTWIGRLADSLSQVRPQAVRRFATADLSTARDWLCK